MYDLLETESETKETLRCLILASDDVDIRTLSTTLSHHKTFVVRSEDISLINVGSMFQLIFIEDKIFQSNLPFITQIQSEMSPCELVIIRLTKSSEPPHLGSVDTLDLTLENPHFEQKIALYCHLANREKFLVKLHSRYARMSQHLEKEENFTKHLYERVAGLSCFNSPNIQMQYTHRSLYRGDVFLAARKPSGNLFILFGDFSGQGLSTAIGGLPTTEIFFGMTRKGFSFESILREINKKLHSILPAGNYPAACMAEINTNKTELQIWNGGLPDIYLTNKEGEIIERYPSMHDLLGEKSDDEFSSEILSIKPNKDDNLIFYGSGLFRLKNPRGELLSDTNLSQFFNANREKDSLIEHLKDSLSVFCNKKSIIHDMSIIQIGFAEEPEAVTNPEAPQDNRPPIIPIDWSMEFFLGPHSLRHFDPLPAILNILMEQPSLQSHRSRLFAIMAELYSNALDHGVLGLDSKDKGDIQGFQRYYQMRTERLATLENAYIKIKLRNEPDSISGGGKLTLIIEDSGPGFDYSKNRLDYEDNSGYSGRGMPMIEDMCERVRYFGRGNCVEIVYAWH